ncbi:conserved Plasmodium protein, unknown function [Plasmodium relictum]|uniref:subtilisin n=1 Tax=Plasmodium relictum TaxID=85471 RepID=A0A1J1H734_PLARL|nr:conserved Plasmodium protein, unknown function [Plasmodium relictum]CRH00596.1 conserved Plasmodium protein, unknown function [Plasmodium relictum]
MFFFNKNFSSLVVITILFLVLFTFKDFHFSDKFPQKNEKQRLLFENLRRIFSEKLDIYDSRNVNIPTFVELKLKNNNDKEIKKINNQNRKNEDYIKKCEDESRNFLKNIYIKIKKIFGGESFDKYDCINSVKYKKFNENLKYIMENNAAIERTPICLIDTGIDTKDNLIKHFLNSENENKNYEYYSSNFKTQKDDQYGINTENCNEHNYSYCESSNLEDINNHGTFVANTIIQSDLLKEKKVFKKSTRLVICKAFGNKASSHLTPLIKCLEYCKMKNVKIIHVSYNIYEKNEKLIRVMDDLKKSQIIIVSPSQHIYNANKERKNDDDEYRKAKFYPSSFSENYENVFSIGALEYSHLSHSDKINIKLLNKDDKEILNRDNTTLFNFTYRTYLSEKKDSDIEYSPNYASASFVNTLIVILNINPKLSLSKIRKILKKSVVVEKELKKLSEWGGYIDVFRVIDRSLKDRKKFYKLLYMELNNEEQQKLSNIDSKNASVTGLHSNTLHNQANNQRGLDKIGKNTNNDFIEFKRNQYMKKEKEKQYYNNHHDNSLLLSNNRDNDVQSLLGNINRDIPRKRENTNSLDIEKTMMDHEVNILSKDLKDSQEGITFDNNEIFNGNKNFYNSEEDKYNLNKTYPYDENVANSDNLYGSPSYVSFLQRPLSDEMLPRHEEHSKYQTYGDDYYNFGNSSNYENEYKNSNYGINRLDEDYSYENEKRFNRSAPYDFNKDIDYINNTNNYNYRDDKLSLLNQNHNSSEELYTLKNSHSPYLEESRNYTMPQPYEMQIDEPSNIHIKRDKLINKERKSNSRYSKNSKKLKKRKQRGKKPLSKRNKSGVRNLSKKTQRNRKRSKIMKKRGKKIDKNQRNKERSKIMKKRGKQIKKNQRKFISKKSKPKQKRLLKNLKRKRKLSRRIPLKKRSSLKTQRKRQPKAASKIIKNTRGLPKKKVLIKKKAFVKKQRKIYNKR